MKKKKFSIGGTIFFMVCCAAVVIGIYLAISRGRSNTTEEIDFKETEAGILLKKDLLTDYPATPREVLKLYCRITKCIYNDELEPKIVEKLCKKIRELYSVELLEANPETEMLGLLLGEIAKYREKKMTIYSYAIDSGINAKSLKTKAGDTTIYNMYFTLRSGGTMDRAYEEFSLIKDSAGRWKIAGWRSTESLSITE
ncbi:MAG: hypothetical protein MJ131_09460 [Lachnospiraceae bacterium]|nr:hypothetical protein [Lachnospiraceae bacterium]